MELLVGPFEALVNVVELSLFSEFVQKATDTCVTDDMHTAIVVIRLHHGFDVRENVLTRGPRHGDYIGDLAINERVTEHLRLVGGQDGEGGTVKSRTEDTGTFEVLLFDVVAHVNLVVGVHGGNNGETYGIGGEGQTYESGGVFSVSHSTGADVGDADRTIIGDNGHLQGLTHTVNGFLTHFLSQKGVGLTLLNKEVKRPILGQTMFILVKPIVLDANGIENGCC